MAFPTAVNDQITDAVSTPSSTSGKARKGGKGKSKGKGKAKANGKKAGKSKAKKKSRKRKKGKRVSKKKLRFKREEVRAFGAKTVPSTICTGKILDPDVSHYGAAGSL